MLGIVGKAPGKKEQELLLDWFRRTVASGILLGFASLLATLPASAESEIDLSGVWEVTGQTQLYGYFHFFVDMRRIRFSDGELGWEAIKRTDTRNVPARELHFRGRVDTYQTTDAETGEPVTRRYLTANVQVAFPGFLEPRLEEHVFAITSADQVELATDITSTVVETRDAAGNETLGTDRWIYRKWDLRSFHVAAPDVRDVAFITAANRLRSEIRDLRHDLERIASRVEARETELAAVIVNDPDGRRAEALLKAKDEALERYLRAQEPSRAETPPVPEPLRRMSRHLAFLQAEKTRVEDQVLAIDEGPGHAERLQRLFARITSIEQQIRDTEAALRRIAREEGLEIPREGPPVPPRAEDIAAAEAEYNRAFRAWWEQDRRNRQRPDRAQRLIAELDDLRDRQATMEETLAEKEARAKGYENGRQISSVLVATEQGSEAGVAKPGTVVLEAVPSDVDLDLRELREKYEEYRTAFERIESIRSEHMDKFNEVSAEITGMRDRMVGLIRSSARRQAAVEMIGNLASAAVSWGTGGPVGAVADALFTVAWTCVWNEDCVAFTNYDESQMQQVVKRKRREIEEKHPIDENETCSFLPALEAVDGEHRLPAWARAPNAGPSSAPDLRLVAVGGSAAERWNPPAGVMPVLTGLGMSLREGALVAQSERARVWFNAQVRDAMTRLQLRAQMRAAQERAIRESLGRSSRRVAMDEAAHAARTAMVNAAKSILSDPNASREALVRAQRIIQELAPKIMETEQLSRLNVRKAFENLDELDALIKEETEQLAKMQAKLQKAAKPMKAKLAGAGISVAAGLAIGYWKSTKQAEIRAEEHDLWAEIFTKQMEASLYYKAYQRASCLYWTRLDQIAWIQRAYAPLYFAYDQNAGFKVLTDRTFTDDQSLLVYVATRDSDTALGARTSIGGTPCQRISARACRVDASAWEAMSERRPTLDLLIDLEPLRD